jgi:hypothetical protein
MKNVSYLLISIVTYLIMCYVPGLNLIAFPVEVLCTYLHEFGHAFFAIISGGHVYSLCVNMNGGGVTTTSGGSLGLITMGGYVGSAVFGNIMLRLTTPNSSKIGLYSLGTIILISAFLWFDNTLTTTVLIIFSVLLFFFAGSKSSPFVMSFLGVACVVYIIQDFNVGPTSDLDAYEKEVGLFPAFVWMYIWLVIVIGITGLNLIHLFKTNRHDKEIKCNN